MPPRLYQLAGRAAGLHRRGPASPATASLHDVSQLSALSHALSVLAQDVGGPRGDPLPAHARDCVEQLTWALETLPAGEVLPSDVAHRVWGTIRHRRGYGEEAAAGRLAQWMDERMDYTALPRWSAGRLLGVLHAVAKGCPSWSGSLTMLEEVATVLPLSLAQLSEKDAALLLWSLATLRMEETHPALWALVCRRCTALLPRMDPIRLAVTAHGLLLAPMSPCDAQHALTQALQEAHLHRCEDAEGGGGPLAPLSRDGIAPPAEWELREGHDREVRRRLLAITHTRTADALVGLLERLWTGPLATRGADPRSPETRGDLAEEALHVLRHLGRRRLSEEGALEVLRLLAARRASSRGEEEEEEEEEAVKEAMRAVERRAVGELLAVPPARLRHPLEVLLVLTDVLVGAVAYAERGTVFSASVLDEEEPAARAAELSEAVCRLGEVCVRRGRPHEAAAGGAALWVLAVASDALQRALDAGLGPRPLDTAVVESLAAMRTTARRWATAAFLPEAIEAAEAAKPGPPGAMGLSLLTWACGGPPGIVGLVVRPSTSFIVFHQALAALPTYRALPPRDLFRLLAAMDGAGETCREPLRGVLPSVLEQLHLDHEAPALRAALTTFLTYRVRAHRRMGPGGEGAVGSVPDALLDLFLRLLMETGCRALTAAEVQVVVGCCVQRRGSPSALERAFLLLVTRRLGQTVSLIDAVPLPLPALVDLIECAGELHTHHRPTSTAILAALLRVLVEGAQAGCSTVESLHRVASLLVRPMCEELLVKSPLAQAVCRGAMAVSARTPWTAAEKAVLVAYLVRAGVEVPEDLLQVLRS